MDLDEILAEDRYRLTLILGNGINRYGNAQDTNSWHALLSAVAKHHLPKHAANFPTGISTTEFFDVICLAAESSGAENSLQKEFCKPMEKWVPFEQHRQIAAWARRKNRPVLTTNFDTVLAKACDARQWHHSTKGFTDFYPWSAYYGDGPVSRPSEGFGIWHINGMAHYHRSIRLGLTHYMGSAQRVRDWMHRGGESRLFSSARAIDTWRGHSTWLDAIFRNDLLIIGLALDEVEVFLRWLLIERARLFRKFPELRRKGWYVSTKDISETGKGIFLEGVGIAPVFEADHDNIYSGGGWATA